MKRQIVPGGVGGGEGGGWREIPGNPIKIGAISRGNSAARVLGRNLNGAAATRLLCPYIFFFSFLFSPFFLLFFLSSPSVSSPSGSASLVNYKRQIRAISLGGEERMTCGGAGRGLVSSNSFGKAPSSVKIKGNRAVYRRAALSGGGHLRTELSPCRDENLLATRREYILRP